MVHNLWYRLELDDFSNTAAPFMKIDVSSCNARLQYN